ncbi:MAG: ABC transporter [Planctomycetes bacterium RBG_16_64_10]|nr:MAG: ABC transporter [Planctomycetes bacterium RBG_16_64_10]
MFALGWRYRMPCLLVGALQILLVVIHLAGLGLAGLGIDVIRHALDPSVSVPRWPLGIAPPASWSTFQLVLAIALAILVVALINAVVKYVAAVAAAELSQRVLVQLRSDVYDKLQRLSFRFFDASSSSSLINRAAGDVQAVRTFVDGVIIKVLTVVLSLVVYVAYMLSVHVPLTLACLLTCPLLWWGAVAFSRMVQPQYRRSSELVDQLILTLVENFQGIHVVKGFAREPQEIEKFARANRAVRDQKQRIFRRVSTFQPAMGLLTQANMLILIGYGGYLVIHGRMPLGAGMFVFANLLQEFANQISQIINIANTVQNSLTGAERVFEVLDAPIDIASPARPVRMLRARGAIRFDRVSFAYRPGDMVLHDVSFTVAAGQCFGIVGGTGAGKTSLLSLLARFYDVTAGRVSLDGQDVRALDLEDLRRSIGIVFQDSFLFSNTVATNIAFGHPAARQSDIERAARMASAHDFIADLPQGYNTVVGEYGANLSGGQRQRLAIARALLLNPPILVLDDATAAVDAETEHEIQVAIRSAMRGRTTLLVSNRISALQRTDRIIVLHQGRIIQSGTHQQLVAARGYYRRLAELQTYERALGRHDRGREWYP